MDPIVIVLKCQMNAVANACVLRWEPAGTGSRSWSKSAQLILATARPNKQWVTLENMAALLISWKLKACGQCEEGAMPLATASMDTLFLPLELRKLAI